MKDVARDVGKCQVERGLPCVPRQGGWTLSNSHGEPLRAFRHGTDMDVTSAPSGAL